MGYVEYLRHPNWLRAMREWAAGESTTEISRRLDIPEHALASWEDESVGFWISHGYPADLARLRVRSIHLRPRAPETTRVFDGLVKRTFVPALKQSGYRKTRNTWLRKGGEVWPAVNIQRGPSDGDLISFTSNWVLQVPGYYEEMFPGFPPDSFYGGVMHSRIGDFLPGQHDVWWSVQVGVLARHTPPVLADPREVEAEIETGLQTMIAFLDQVTTIDILIDLINRGGSFMPSMQCNPADAIALLRRLQAAQP